VAVKSKRQEQREGLDRQEMPPTQIARALRELGIVWIPAHSPQAKGRVERQFQTDQDRLVKACEWPEFAPWKRPTRTLRKSCLLGGIRP